MHEAAGAEVSAVNARLEQVKAPFKFSLLYVDHVLIIDRLTSTGGAETDHLSS